MAESVKQVNANSQVLTQAEKSQSNPVKKLQDWENRKVQAFCRSNHVLQIQPFWDISRSRKRQSTPLVLTTLACLQSGYGNMDLKS